MKPSPPERQALEAALKAQVASIFEQAPELHAFSIGERLVYDNPAEGAREWELYVASIAAYPQLGSAEAQAVAGRISGALADLCNERPHAADLLPGRTFARAWH